MSIKKNLAYQLTYEFIVLALPLAVSPYISRVLGAEGLGEYSYSHSLAQYFVLFSMLGIRNYGNRVIAQNRDDPDRLNRVFSSLLVMHLLISALVCLVYFFYCQSWSETPYALLQWPLVASAVIDISWFYYGMEKVRLFSAAGSVMKAACAVLIFLLVQTRQDLWKYCLIMSSGFLLHQMVLWVPLKRYVRIVKPDWKEVLGHFKPLLVLFLPAVAVSVYKYMDKLMIGVWSGKAELGLYQNADTAVGTPLTLIDAFGIVMLSRVSYLVQTDNRQDSDRYLQISIRYVMWLAYAIAFGLAGVSTVFAPVFWGEKFALSGRLMRWLSITVPFIAFSNVIRTQYLLPHGRDREFVVSVSVGAGCNLALNLCLIPSYGAFGATIGTVVTEIVVCVLQVAAVRRELPIADYLKSTLPFLIAGLSMYVLAVCCGTQSGVSLAVLCTQIIGGAAFYILITAGYLYAVQDRVVRDAIERLRSAVGRCDLWKAVLWLLWVLELFLAVPYEYVSAFPKINRSVYALQALAAVLELAYLGIGFFRRKGRVLVRVRETAEYYSWTGVLLVLFVLYHWAVTLSLRSEPVMAASHYLIQILILVLGAARTFRRDEKAVCSATAFYFWLAIVANSLIYLLKPEGLYVSDSAYGIHHACYLFGLDNQFGKIYFAGFALIWFFEERYKDTHFMSLSAFLLILYVYFKGNNGTGMMVSIVLILLVLVYNLKWLRWALSMKLFLALIAVLSFHIYSQNGFMHSSGPLIEAVARFTQKSSTFSGRVPVWEAAAEKIRESPVFGYGRVPENVHIWIDGRGYYNAHNQVLQVLLDGGWIGLCTFAAPMLYTDRAGAKLVCRNPEIRILYIGVVTSLLYFMMEVGTMLPMFLCMLLVGLFGSQSAASEQRAGKILQQDLRMETGETVS